MLYSIRPFSLFYNILLFEKYLLWSMIKNNVVELLNVCKCCSISITKQFVRSNSLKDHICLKREVFILRKVAQDKCGGIRKIRSRWSRDKSIHVSQFALQVYLWVKSDQGYINESIEFDISTNAVISIRLFLPRVKIWIVITKTQYTNNFKLYSFQINFSPYSANHASLNPDSCSTLCPKLCFVSPPHSLSPSLSQQNS